MNEPVIIIIIMTGLQQQWTDTQKQWMFIVFLNPYFLSKVLGPSPYSAVGDIINRRIIVTVSAIIYSLGMFTLNVRVFIYCIFTAIYTSETI
jgi:hypothetical protein